MAQVPTVTGSIDTAELGPTLMHEHVFVLSPEIIQNYGDTYWDAEERIADAVSKLNDLASRGIRSIVDPTVIGLGRYLPWVQRVAEQVELQIVAATGLYTYNDVPFFFHYRGLLFDTDPDPMVTFFVKDITEGIAETGVKAGIIKCATDADGLTPGVERVLRACARTHRETGVPITTHTDAGSFRGRDQQRVFAEEGVDLSRVVIGHSGDSQDLDYLRELMDKGSMIGMDRFGIDVYLPTERPGPGGGRPVCAGLRRSHGPGPRRRLLHGLVHARADRDHDPELALQPHLRRRAPRAAGPGRHPGPDRPDARGQPPPPLRDDRRLLTAEPRPAWRRASGSGHDLCVATWKDVETADPAFAARVRALFDAHKHKTIATLRADGSPASRASRRSSRTAQLTFGSMPGARKGADLVRDPRFALHSASEDPPEDDPSGWNGDAKVAGRAVLVGDLEGDTSGQGFRAELDEVVLDAAERRGRPPAHRDLAARGATGARGTRVIDSAPPNQASGRRSASRRANFWTLPVAVRGRSATSRISSGHF